MADVLVVGLMLAPLLVLAGVVAWITVGPSKRRWPHLNAWERYVALVTFDAPRQDRYAQDHARTVRLGEPQPSGESRGDD